MPSLLRQSGFTNYYMKDALLSSNKVLEKSYMNLTVFV